MSSNLKGSVGNVSSFKGEKYDIFHWKIQQFSLLSDYVDHFYRSPNFVFKGFPSYLTFYPNGKSPHSVGYFTLVFFSKDYNLDECYNTVYMKLGIKTLNGCTEKWFCRNIEYPHTYGFGLEDVIHRSTFLKRKSELAPGDCLTFVLFLSSNAPKLIKDYLNVSVQTESESVVENETSEKKGGEKVVEDIGKLLASGDKSDVVIHVEDTDFKVHGCILAARTPVFSALFEHETVEKTSNEITIKDCEPSIFKDFLNHIYTGSVQDLTTETAFGLFHVADKYLVTDLKAVCRKHIEDTLSIDSFCGAIELALRYEEHGLLQSAIDFFVVHFKQIIKSVEWQRYIEENPREANEILIKAFSSS